MRNIPKALEEVRRAVAILPKRAIYHVNLAIYSAYAGDSQTAAKEAGGDAAIGARLCVRVRGTGVRQPGAGHVGSDRQDYQKIAKTNPSDAAAGLADLAMYEGRYRDAVKILEKGAADDTAAQVTRTPPPISSRRWPMSSFCEGKRRGAHSAEQRARSQQGRENQVHRGAELCRPRRNSQSAGIGRGALHRTPDSSRKRTVN